MPKPCITLIISEVSSPSWLPSRANELIVVLRFAIHFVHPHQSIWWIAIYFNLACIGPDVIELARAIYLLNVVPLLILKPVGVHFGAALAPDCAESTGMGRYHAAAVVLRASRALCLENECRELFRIVKIYRGHHIISLIAHRVCPIPPS